MRHGDDHGMEWDANANILSQCAMCKGWVWQQQNRDWLRRLQHYAHAHVFPKCFKSLAHFVGFRVVRRVDLVLRVVNGVLVAVIVHSICIPNSCIFHIAKTGLLRCCLYTPRRLQQTAVSCKRSICNKIEWIRESHSSEVFAKVL